MHSFSLSSRQLNYRGFPLIFLKQAIPACPAVCFLSSSGYRFFLIAVRHIFIDPFSFFSDIDCCIHIPIHPVSTFTDTFYPTMPILFFFLMSTYTANLARCKITVYLYKMFPRSSSLYPSMDRNCPYHYPAPFPRCSPPTFPADSDLPRILHHIFQQAPCLALLEIFSLWFFIFFMT